MSEFKTCDDISPEKGTQAEGSKPPVLSSCWFGGTALCSPHSVNPRKESSVFSEGWGGGEKGKSLSQLRHLFPQSRRMFSESRTWVKGRGVLEEGHFRCPIELEISEDRWTWMSVGVQALKVFSSRVSVSICFFSFMGRNQM